MKTAIILSTLLTVALAAPAPSANQSLKKRQGQNFQTFTGALGGIAATPITDSGNPDRKFQVKGDTFVNIGAALQRSCDQQFNACANAANGGDKTLSVSACSDQKTQCDAAGQGNTGATAAGSANAAVSSTAAAASTGAAKVPCNQASNGNSGNANAGSNANADAATSASASSNATASATPTATAGAKKPCNTGAANANASAGNAKKNKAKANKGAKASKAKANKGAAAAANPCNKKRGNKRSGNKRSVTQITRRYKVA